MDQEAASPKYNLFSKIAVIITSVSFVNSMHKMPLKD